MNRNRQLRLCVAFVISLLLIHISSSPRGSSPISKGLALGVPDLLFSASFPRNQARDSFVPDVVISAPVQPVTVEMSDLPPDPGLGNSRYERWLRGELDLNREERLSEQQISELKEAAMSLTADPNVQQLRSDSALLSLLPSAGFDSLDVNDCCGGGATVPPDPELSVGPNHLIAVVNVAFEIYDKTGVSLSGPNTFSALFASLPLGNNCTGSKPFDPNSVYDEEADRFILAVDGDGKSYCVAVSQTADPTGAWSLYEFATDVGGRFFDFPHAGVGRDALYMGGNMFTGNSFDHGRIWAFDKSAMYAGAAAGAVSHSLGLDGTPQPANLHGFAQGTWPTTGPHYILTDGDYDGSAYTLYSWNDPFGANELVTQGDLDLPAVHGVAVSFPVDNKQAGGGDITANDYRVLDFEYRNGSGWTAMTVGCNPGTGTVNCVQWAEVDLSSATVVQAGVFASDGEYRYFPDLAANHCGDAMIGYTKSSAGSFPSVWATGRESGDPGGAMRAETLLRDGEGTYSSFGSTPYRWGDYTGMSADPDGLRFWYLGEFSKNVSNSGAKWGTYIGSFTSPNCDIADGFILHVSPNSRQVCVPNETTYEILVQGVTGFDEAVTLSTAGVPSGYEPIFTTNPVTPTSSTILTLTKSGPVTAGLYTIDITGTATSDIYTASATLALFTDSPESSKLLTPANDATGVPLTPQFSWTDQVAAISYLLEVATDPAFTTIVYTATVNSSTHTAASQLAKNTEYYWRITGTNACGPSAASQASRFTTAHIICRFPDVNIPDNSSSGVGDILFVPEAGVITDLNLGLDVSHTWVGDLSIEIEHANVVTEVMDRPGIPGSFLGCSGDDINAIIDDEGSDGPVETSCNSSPPAISGTLTPVPGSLAAFDGLPTAGTWQLTISDQAPSDSGTLNSWCLIFEAAPARQLFLPWIAYGP